MPIDITTGSIAAVASLATVIIQKAWKSTQESRDAMRLQAEQSAADFVTKAKDLLNVSKEARLTDEAQRKEEDNAGK
jgi:hypothetical protein